MVAALSSLMITAERASAAGDADNDGFSDAVEAFVGTNPNLACSQTTVRNDEPVDAWPPDFNDDRSVDLLDVTLLRSKFESITGDGVYNARYDLNADGEVDLLDVVIIRTPYNVTCTPAPATPTPPPATPTAPATPSPVPTAPPVPGQWAFSETFDGAPNSPQPWSSNRFDMVVGSNDPDAVINGQTIITPEPLVVQYGTIEAGHGSNCGAPQDQGDANTHNITVDQSPQGFQTNTRPQLVFQCNNHVMTTLKTGYGIVSMSPRQLIDWNGRTATIEFDNNVYGFFRNWMDVYIVPEDEMLLEMVHKDEGGTGEQFPKRAVRFSFAEAKPRVGVINDYNMAYEWKNWQRFVDAFPNDPASTDPRIRRTFRLQFSTTSWTVSVQKQDGTFWSFSGNWPTPLSFTRGQIRFEHHSYNPTKDGIFGQPWSQYTYHWDNIRFDGPVLGARKAFELPPTYINVPGYPLDSASSPVTINVTSTNQPRLIGHVYSQAGMVDPANTSHWGQVSVNNGPWIDIRLRKNVDADLPDRSWSTIDTPLTGLVNGANTLRFRYHARPPGATWQADGLRVKDLEIQVEDRPIVAGASAAPSDFVVAANDSPFNCTIDTYAATAQDVANEVKPLVASFSALMSRDFPS